MTDNARCYGLVRRAIKQLRNAQQNLERAACIDGHNYIPNTAEAKASKILTVLANSMEFHGSSNRGQVEAAVADYFDFIQESN